MAGERILIVEDERVVARDLEVSLRQLGYEVVGTARASTEAITKAAQTLPHLVLMDIVLEGARDGVQTAEAMNKRFDTKVVYLTAHSDRHTVLRAQATGPAGYIVKPFTSGKLKAAVEQALRDTAVTQKRPAPRLEMLVIEDDSELAARVLAALHTFCRVKVATTFAQAVRNLRESSVDLIVADLAVGDFGRGQGLRRLRDDLGVSAPAILLATEVTEDDTRLLKTAGVLALLTADDELLSKLQTQVEDLRLRSGSTPAES